MVTNPERAEAPGDGEGPGGAVCPSNVPDRRRGVLVPRRSHFRHPLARRAVVRSLAANTEAAERGSSGTDAQNVADDHLMTHLPPEL